MKQMKHHETSWNIMKHHKTSWNIMKHHETSWNIMKHHETSWNIMKHHETSWNIMKHHETSWNIMKHHETSWNIMKHHETSWNIMKHHETSWNIMKHHETSWNIMKHHETSWNIMKHHETSWNTICLKSLLHEIKPVVPVASKKRFADSLICQSATVELCGTIWNCFSVLLKSLQVCFLQPLQPIRWDTNCAALQLEMSKVRKTNHGCCCLSSLHLNGWMEKCYETL